MPAIEWCLPMPQKAGVRYRYYVSTPFLHGEAKTASAGSVSRIPAADIEDVIVKSLKEHLAAKQDQVDSRRCAHRGSWRPRTVDCWHCCVQGQANRSNFKSDNADEASDCADDQSLLNSLAETTLQKVTRNPGSRIMGLEAKSARSNSSAGRAWSAQSPEVVGGWMMLFQVV